MTKEKLPFTVALDVSDETVRSLRAVGLNDTGIKNFIFEILERYLDVSYLNQDKTNIDELNEK